MDTLPMPDMLGDFMDEFNEEVPSVGESGEIPDNNALWLLSISGSYFLILVYESPKGPSIGIIELGSSIVSPLFLIIYCLHRSSYVVTSLL